MVYRDIQSVLEARLPWEDMREKSVLITGANGFIGHYLVLTLLEYNDRSGAGITVYALVRSEENARRKFGELAQRGDLKLVVQDVCQPIAQVERADYVIHAASQASAYHFEHDPVGTMNANLIGTEQVLQFAQKSGTLSTLFVSSLKVYGEVRDGSSMLREPVLGSLDINSYQNCYAQGKRAAETLCACYCQQYGLPVKIVRPSYIYGASSLEDDRVWAQFLKNVVKRENILLKSSGAPLRSFCYLSDTVKAFFTVLLLGKDAKPYNIAARHSDTTIRDFAKCAVEVFPERGLTLSFARKEDEVLPPRPASAPTPEIMDSGALEALGWQADVDLEEGIRRSVQILEARCDISG
ncbi:MAG: NAD(P)-dependent oxidoreductase [Clostridiales bacterium]|nr:NAD(P)-dependent oxidoreductase [Clostridiales bacterium]